MDNIVRSKWGIHNRSIEKINALYGDVYNLDNKYILKIININSNEKQGLINSFMNKAHEKGFPVPRTTQTKEGGLFFSESRKTYSLYDYISGNHYDFKEGSLIQAATTLARFHDEFEKELELEQEVEKVCGDVYPYDLSGIKYYTSEVREAVKLIDRSERFCVSLPRQIGHFDYIPSNLIFKNGKMIGLIDFDIMRVSEKARDLAISLHRLTKNELQKKLFLDSYGSINNLTDAELQSMNDLYFDEMKRKLIYTIRRYNISPKPFKVLFDRIKNEKLERV